MVAAPLIFVASSIFGLSQAAPLTPFSHFTHYLVGRDTDSYKVYGGDGTVAQGWPAISDWVDYDSMWDANSKLLSTSCTSGIPSNSKKEIAAIKAGIEEAAKGADMDHRFILAIIMQESGGCVRVNTTYSPGDGIRNPGLMQDFNGKHTCNDPKKGTPMQNPCKDETIKGMVTDGAGVTNDGGLKQAIENSKVTDDSKYYKAARIYNSGAVDKSGNLGKGGATHCYASDVANRLTGWVSAKRLCEENTIGNVQGKPGGPKSPSNSTTTAAPKPTGTGISGAIPPTLVPTSAPFSNGTTVIPTETVVPSTTGTASLPTDTSVNGAGVGTITSQPVGPKGQGAVKNCKAWYTVKSGDNCESIENFYGLPRDTLKKFNTGLDKKCTNLELGASYCVRDR
ncbi:carbohydrate-binding module family 50 protein [Zopfia rhizophila CBS 207.26]|uniref:Carbohydrate-binding module family 50 protein n=1 Tax=Zopfia rhizophila CBS 207.26 TaxID=1314779 RepID=A0A6A6EFB9_9PEZI|nr:carbohydrate-binding module family 50 protein [Zopfia rhizophila CBS 207.26]